MAQGNIRAAAHCRAGPRPAATAGSPRAGDAFALMESFHGCTALITGASAGLGREFAWQLAPHARALILAARRTDRLEELKRELSHDFPALAVHVYGIDLADRAATDAFVRWLWSENLRVSFLINNAGLGDHGPFENSDPEKIARMLDVNIRALTQLTRQLLPMLRAAGRAAILNVSSTAAFLPVPHMAVYAATKAYVSSFSEALRAELRGSGIAVTALCPGPVDTEFGAVASRAGSRMNAPEFLKESPASVVRAALRAVARDRARVVPGLPVALVMLLATAVPMALLRLGLGLAARRMAGGESAEVVRREAMR